ncbi:basic proline-rich protein-like [Pyrgilauda ruficollis]|uniref:basic proline-rich protein-like n=1 Tax=Pyrgilauda ruficollis TaxID=221976 RepID=UPI001B8867F2|nr:basic proline-rich protein-like [Pyrgilauda ruficollis]
MCGRQGTAPGACGMPGPGLALPGKPEGRSRSYPALTQRGQNSRAPQMSPSTAPRHGPASAPRRKAPWAPATSPTGVPEAGPSCALGRRESAGPGGGEGDLGFGMRDLGCGMLDAVPGGVSAAAAATAGGRPRSTRGPGPNPGPNPYPSPCPNPGPVPDPAPGPNPGPAPGPSPGLNPGPNAGPAPGLAPVPAPGPNPGPNPGPGQWRLPPDRSAASAEPGPRSGARRCSAGSRDRTPAFKHPAKPSAACPPSAPALGTVGPQPHQRRSRLSEAVGSRLAPLCILRDFSSHRQLAKAQGHTGRYSSARPGGTLRDGRESCSRAGAEPGAGTARTAPALPEKPWGSRAAPTPCTPTRGGRQSSCSGPAAALPGRGTEGARQTRAKIAVSLGRRDPGTPSPAGEQRPPPIRRSSRQRRHSIGRSVAAVLASCLSLFARRRKGRIRRLSPAGMPGSGGAGTGPLRSRACGGRGSAPARAAFPAPRALREIPVYSGHLAEFRRFKAREAARVASLPKRTINRHPPAGAGKVGEPRFPRQTPTPRLRSGRSRRPSLPRPPPKTLGQFPSFLTPRSLLRKALAGLGLGGSPMPATLLQCCIYGQRFKFKPYKAQLSRPPVIALPRAPSPTGGRHQPSPAGSAPPLSPRPTAQQQRTTKPPTTRLGTTPRPRAPRQAGWAAGGEGFPPSDQPEGGKQPQGGRSEGRRPGRRRQPEHGEGTRGEPRTAANKARRRDTAASAPTGALTSCPAREEHLARHHPGLPRSLGNLVSLPGTESEGARGAAAHPDIHLKKEHPMAAPFPPLLSLKREIERDKKNDPRTSRPPHNQSGRTREVASVRSASRWAKSPGGAAPAPQPGQAGPRTAATLPPAEPAIPAAPGPPRRARHRPCKSPPVHPTRERSPIAGPCRQRRNIPWAPTRVSCRGQRLLAFRSPFRGLLTKDF